MNCKVCGKTSAKNNSVSFFRFPKETFKCEYWAERCNLSSLFKQHGTLRFYKSFRICSDHFDPKHVVFDGRKKRLLPSAVPFTETRKTHVKRIESLCRLCAEENKNLTDIYGWRGKLLNLEGKLKYLPLKLNKLDSIPPKICSQCLTKLNQFHDFVCDCLKADTKLRQIYCLSQDNNTSEITGVLDCKNNTQESPLIEGKPEEDLSKNISFDHNYSNILWKDEFKIEPESRNGKSLSFAKDGKEPCDIFLESFQLINAQCSPLVGESDLRKEFQSEPLDKTFYSRFDFDQYLPKHLTKVCDTKVPNHEVALLENDSRMKAKRPERSKPDQPHLKSFTSETKGRKERCRFCDRSFKSRQACSSHATKHTGETPYECKECGKTFRSRASLRQHRSVHSDRRLHPCHLCGMSFKRKDTLGNHLRIHTGERPFVCRVCGFAFKQRGDCVKHEKNHERKLEKPTMEPPPHAPPSYENPSGATHFEDMIPFDLIM